MIYGEYIFPATCLADDREAMARGWKEIVRCKDCKAFNGMNCVRNNMIAVRTDDYCSRAERREE